MTDLSELLERVRECVKEHAENGFWRTCSGCHESEDGYDVGHYPFSKEFDCKLGAGCGECGGIGAVWDTTDYQAMGEALSREPHHVPDAEQATAILARALCQIDGLTPDDDAPRMTVCGPYGEVLPNWEAYRERAEGILAAGLASVELLPTREQAAEAAAVLMRCNGHDLDVWSEGSWPADAEEWLVPLSTKKDA